MTPRPGERVGDWIVDRPLGRGGMGAVYACHSALSDRWVAAVKICGTTTPAGRARFVREVEALASLRHPNIVAVRSGGHDVERDLLYVAMDLVVGEDLERVLERGAVAPGAAARILAGAAQGLAHAHERRVAHRDVKPANLVLTPKGEAVVVDFGIAELADRSALTQAGAVPGTLLYLPPEALEGSGSPAWTWDVYALGVVLFELLAGRRAFETGDGLPAAARAARLLAAKTDGRVLDPGAHVPEPLRRLVAEATDRRPLHRPSMAELALRLAEQAEDVPTVRAEAGSPSGAGSREDTWDPSVTPAGASPTVSGASPTVSGAPPTVSGAPPTVSGASPTTSGALTTTSGATTSSPAVGAPPVAPAVPPPTRRPGAGLLAGLAAAGLAAAGLAAAGLTASEWGSGDLESVRLGLVIDPAGRGDHGFYDLAWAGGEEVRRRGGTVLELRVEGGLDAAEHDVRHEHLNLVIGVGQHRTDEIVALAERLPDTRFVAVDAAPGAPTLPNLTAVTFREHEGAYLGGQVAGRVTRTRSVGFVGGLATDPVRRFEAGFTAGVRDACPDCTLRVVYLGDSIRAFNDPPAGEAAADGAYDAGADVLFHAAGRSGTGVMAAASRRGRFVVGVDADQFDLAPCCVLTSIVKRLDRLVVDLAVEHAGGALRAGVRDLGLREGAIDWVRDDRNAAWVTAEVRASVDAARERIAAGTLVVPSTHSGD